MRDFAGRIAVVTGGGSGMGRELVRQLVVDGCNVAMYDVSIRNLEETKRLCEIERVPQGLRITLHAADVADEAQVLRLRDEVAERQETDKIHLLFNNAGIGGGGSMFASSRNEWERTFNICWFGSEALITDLQINAPHIKCSVVMPGHIGTSIVANSRKIQSGNESDEITEAEVAQARSRIASMGTDPSGMSDDDIRARMTERARTFLEEAPTSAAMAATIILDGVKADRWRILVGEDAHKLDEWVRRTPERAYDADAFEELAAAAGWRLGS
jgi:short subunit dehydrogenase